MAIRTPDNPPIWICESPIRDVVVGRINPDITNKERLEIVRQRIVDTYTPYLTIEALGDLEELI